MPRKRRTKVRSNRFVLLLVALVLSGGIGLGTCERSTFSSFVVTFGLPHLLEDVRSSAAVGRQSSSYQAQEGRSFDYSLVAAYEGLTACEVNDGVPFFQVDELSLDAREAYSEFDNLGRAGAACVLIGPESLPEEPRGDISSIKPSGWQQAYYPELIAQSNGALYNRSHLVAYSLAGSDDARNIITGTTHLNQELMQPLESTLLTHVKRGAHILYRVTPVFVGDELVARGVLLEAQSIEDLGEGTQLRWCWWCPNVQRGVVIDYASGKSMQTSDGLEK